MIDNFKHSKDCGNYPVEGQCLVHTRIGDRCSCKCHKEGK